MIIVVLARDRGLRKGPDRKSTRLNSSHRTISYAVFCLKKKKKEDRAEECTFLYLRLDPYLIPASAFCTLRCLNHPRFSTTIRSYTLSLATNASLALTLY